MTELKLEDLQLVESAAFDINFSQQLQANGKGTLKIVFGEVEIEAGGKIVGGNDDMSILVVKSTPSLQGFHENELGDKVESFSLKIQIRLAYSYPSTILVTEEFIENSQWFFSSQIRNFFKVFADNTLRHTTIREIKIPY